MFDSKRLFLLFCVSMMASIGAMDSDGSVRDKSSLIGQPDELKVIVILAIPFGTVDMEQAVIITNALVRSCKEFCRIINDGQVTKDLIKRMVARFGGYHETVAKKLATQGAQEYITSHKDVLKMWQNLFCRAATQEEAQTLLNRMGDSSFVDGDGKSVLYHMTCPFVDSSRLFYELYGNVKNKSEADARKKSFINVFKYVFNYGKQRRVEWKLEKLLEEQVVSRGWHELGILIAQLDPGAILRAMILIESGRPRTLFQGDGGASYEDETENSKCSLLEKWREQAAQSKQ